jgi:ribosomal protein S12 methylthiotransferase accessory factor YcaO
MSERNNAPESRRNRAIPEKSGTDASLHPAWLAFVQYCQQMGHGEIERLKIQDGIPVLVEVSRQKIKFS